MIMLEAIIKGLAFAYFTFAACRLIKEIIDCFFEHGADADVPVGVRSSGLLPSERSETGDKPSTGGQPGIAPASAASRGNIILYIKNSIPLALAGGCYASLERLTLGVLMAMA
jgi:hypothetical protein